MPTYEYACTSCGHRLEAVQSFSDDPLTTCPDCDGDLRKVYGAVGIVLKGSGFYKTDSRTSAGGKAGGGHDSTSSSDGAAAKDSSGSKEGSGGDGAASKESSNGKSSESAKPASSAAASSASSNSTSKADA